MLESLCALGEHKRVLKDMRSYWDGMLREGLHHFGKPTILRRNILSALAYMNIHMVRAYVMRGELPQYICWASIT